MALYLCVDPHTSGDFATDLAAGKWRPLSGTGEASNTRVTPSGDIAATTVQDAIDELDAEKQPLDALLTAIAALSMVADRYIYGTGTDAVALGTITAAGRAILDDATAADQRTTMGAAGLGANTFTAAQTLSGNPSSALHAAPKQYVDAVAGSAGAGLAGGRLTLESGVSVSVSDQSAKTSIYYTPHPGAGNLVPIYNGSAWTARVFTELTLALDSNSGHTGYHQSGKLFDLFVYDSSGTLKLATGPAWTDSTNRSAAISLVAGRYVNDASIVLRFGSGTDDTATVAANLATYVGTFLAIANGQTEDTLSDRKLWNMFNRVQRPMRAVDTTDTWAYTTATIRQANANTDNQLDAVFGLAQDAVEIDVVGLSINSSANVSRKVGVGVDSTTVDSSQIRSGQSGAVGANGFSIETAAYRGYAAVGSHSYVWLEFSQATGTTTWRGDDGGAIVQAGIMGRVWA